MKRLFTFLFTLVLAVTFTSAVKADDDFSESAENNTYTSSAENDNVLTANAISNGKRVPAIINPDNVATIDEFNEFAKMSFIAGMGPSIVIAPSTIKTVSDVTSAASTLGINVDGYTANFYEIGTNETGVASTITISSATITLYNVPLVTSNSKVKVIHWKSSDGLPEELPATVNSDGSVTFTMTSFSPVAVLVNNNTTDATTPIETPSTKTPTKKASEKTGVR